MLNQNNLSEKIAQLSPKEKELLKQKLAQINKDKIYESSPQINGHEIIATALKDNGITHVYTIGGIPIHETLSRCAKKGIRVLGVRHQQAGVMMASAQNYIEGKLTAVVILSAGPAVTNATIGILVAQDNCMPLLVIGSRRALQNEGIGYFQELDATPIFKSITKSSQLIDSTAKITDSINQSLSIAEEGRKGVSYLEIPEDILENKIQPQPKKRSQPDKIELLPDQSITQAVDLLKKAQRPVFVIGRGVRWDNAYEELKYLVEEFNIPFTTSPMAQGFISDNHPLCYNSINAHLFAQADVILVVGARLNWTFRFGSEFPKNGKLIHIDIHPLEIGNNITPTVGIVAPAKTSLQEIISQLKDTKINVKQSWLKSLNNYRQEKLKQWNLLAEDDTLPISPHRLIKEIREILPQDAIVSIDGNVILATAQRLLPSYSPVSRFTSGTNGCMGVGIPFAMGAKMAQPQRPVVVITGDLALGMNAMEMETAVRYNLPIVVIVANNDGNTGCLMERKWYPPDNPDRITMFQPNIHYEKIMKTFGGNAEYVERISEIKPALIKALNTKLPTCINVRINQETPYPSK